MNTRKAAARKDKETLNTTQASSMEPRLLLIADERLSNTMPLTDRGNEKYLTSYTSGRWRIARGRSSSLRPSRTTAWANAHV